MRSNRLVDIHCHIIPGVDDGPEVEEEFLSLARHLAGLGFSDIIATPHTKHDLYDISHKNIVDGVQKCNRLLKKNGIDVTVHPGAEYPLQPGLTKSSAELTTLNNSRYILLELPFSQPIPHYAEQAMFEFRARGLVPILAHPERASALQQEPHLADNLIQYGAMLQVNLSSLQGVYGKRVHNTALEWIKAGKVQLLATDSHRVRRLNLLKLRRGIRSFDTLMVLNPRAVLEDKPIAPVPPHQGLLRRMFGSKT